MNKIGTKKSYTTLLLTAVFLNGLLSMATAAPEVDVVEAVSEVAVPSGPSHHRKHHHHHVRHQAMNVMSTVKAVKITESDKAIQVDVTFSSNHITDFANTPHKTINEKAALSQIEGFVKDHLRDYRFALGFSGTFFMVSAKPAHLERVNGETIRITLNPKTTSVSELHKLRYFVDEMNTHAAADVPYALFIDYGAVPHSDEAKVPFSKRATFFVDALHGVTLMKEKKHGKTEHSVVFKDVAEITSVSSRGRENRMSEEKFAKMIGSGKHPFKPNRSFIVLKDGAPRQCTFAFDKATYDPKTHNMTFKVGLLTDEKSSKADFTECFDGKSTSYSGKVTLFLDNTTGGK
jgi:hypothetical protein